jgi:hypothetical protein
LVSIVDVASTCVVAIFTVLAIVPHSTRTARGSVHVELKTGHVENRSAAKRKIRKKKISESGIRAAAF